MNVTRARAGASGVPLVDRSATPGWACGSYRALMNELRAIELDTMDHVHVENHVLMPRFPEASR